MQKSFYKKLTSKEHTTHEYSMNDSTKTIPIEDGSILEGMDCKIVLPLVPHKDCSFSIQILSHKNCSFRL